MTPKQYYQVTGEPEVDICLSNHHTCCSLNAPLPNLMLKLNACDGGIKKCGLCGNDYLTLMNAGVLRVTSFVLYVSLSSYSSVTHKYSLQYLILGAAELLSG